MARRTSTMVTLEVQIELPAGVTNPRVCDFVWKAITSAHRDLTEDDPMRKLAHQHVMVKLVKRATTYV